MAVVKKKEKTMDANEQLVPDEAFDEEFLASLEDGGGWLPATDAGAQWHAAQGLVTTDGVQDTDGDIMYELTPLGVQWLTASRAAPRELPASPAASPAPVVPITGATTIAAIVAQPAPAQPAPAARKRAAPVFPASLAHISSDVDSDAPPPVRTRAGVIRTAGESPVRKALNFDALEIGQSRHIAVTEEIPEPWKHYASSVALENRRHATQRMNPDGSPVVQLRNVKAKDGTKHPKPFGVFDYSKKFYIYKAADNDPRGPGARVKRVQPD
jgi:hypothetical protein